MKTLYQKSIKDANREAKWGYVCVGGGGVLVCVLPYV